MSWKWEDFTSPNFAHAVREVDGVCIVPLGITEKHGEHLPLGTDSIAVYELAERATALEPAIIFPYFYFGQGHETKHYPGAIAIRSQLLTELLDNICAEISRNGMKKIIFLNGHGGNEFFLSQFLFTRLEQPHDYSIYLVRLNDYMRVEEDPGWKAMMVSEYDYHAGEVETSTMLAIRPELVHLEDVPAPAVAQRHLAHLPGTMTPVWWYADYPDHYAGDARASTVAKGEFLLDNYVQKIAAIIKSVKADTRVAALEAEYFSRIQHG